MTDSPLPALRAELSRQGLDGFIVPRADEHLGEYVPASAERLCCATSTSTAMKMMNCTSPVSLV